MDWKLFATTFGAIFLAEFADKTQLATLAFSAGSKKPWVVFAAASLALVLVTAVGAAAGGLVARWVPAHGVTRGAAILFVAIGVWLFVASFRGP